MGVTYDTQRGSGAAAMQRTVDVYVTEQDGRLEVAAYLIHENTQAPAAGENRLADKSAGYVNAYETCDLTVAKRVEGNLGANDQYFAFTVRFEGADAGTVYTVDLSDADAVSGSSTSTAGANRGQTNPDTLTVGADGTVSQRFYLKDGQQIVIGGIAKGTGYTVSEDAEDYQPAASVSGSDTDAAVAGSNDSVTDSDLEGDAAITFTNTRAGQIPTGIMADPMPLTVLLALCGGIALYLAHKARRGAR